VLHWVYADAMSPKGFSVGLDTNIETRVLLGHPQYQPSGEDSAKSTEAVLLQMAQKIENRGFLWWWWWFR